MTRRGKNGPAPGAARGPHSGGRRQGQAAVELAFMVPVLVVLLLAGLDFARLFFTSMAITDAARAGAAYGSTNRAAAADVSGMEQAACNSMSDIPCSAGVNAVASSFCQCAGSTGTVSCTSPGACTYLQVFVRVTTNATFHTIVPYPLIPNSVPLTAASVMQVQ
jgi:Flp pilus assembly protein TadG